MDCTVPGNNIRFVTKAVQALSKVGDELHLEAKEGHLSFVTTNMSKTVFAEFKFNSLFFSAYQPGDTDSERASNSCSINMKAILSVFRSLKDKNVESCNIKVIEDGTTIAFKIKYRNGASMLHSLHLIDFESLSIANVTEGGEEICATPALYAKMLSMFPLSDNEISFEITKEKLCVKNYNSGTRNAAKTIRTELKWGAGEFNIFDVSQEANVTFSLKPFRAAILFAEAFNINVSLKLEIGGRPIVLNMRHPLFDARFVISTINPDGSTQSTTTVRRLSCANVSSNRTDITIEDREILDAINWEEDFDGAADKARSTTGEENNGNLLNNNNNNKTTRGNADSQSTSESPISKRVRMVFSRCFETSSQGLDDNLGEVLVPDSDGEMS